MNIKTTILPNGESIFGGNGNISTNTLFNISIGQESGKILESEGNIFIGYSAGFSSTTTKDCIFIGKSAGANIVSGNCNIILGDNSTSLINNLNGLISIGYTETYNNSISIGNNIINKGNDNINIGKNINSKSYFSIIQGNNLKNTSPFYFKDELYNYSSNIIKDGVNKIGLYKIDFNPVKNLIYKDKNLLSGFDIITSNISNSKNNTINIRNINYNISSFNYNTNYLTSNYFIVKGFTIISKNNILNYQIQENQLILSSSSIKNYNIIGNLTVNNLLNVKTINFLILLQEQSSIYNLVNANNQVFLNVDVIKKIAKPIITNTNILSFQDIINSTSYTEEGINLSLIQNNQLFYQNYYIITKQPLYGNLTSNLIKREELLNINYTPYPELNDISLTDSYGISPMVYIDGEGILGDEITVSINRNTSNYYYYNTIIFTSNTDKILFNYNKNYSINFYSSNLYITYNNNSYLINTPIIKNDVIEIENINNLTSLISLNDGNNINIFYKILNENLFTNIEINTIIFSSIGNNNYRVILNGNLWNNLTSSHYIYVSKIPNQGYFNLGNYFNYSDINKLVYISYGNIFANDIINIRIVFDDFISREYNILIKNYISRFDKVVLDDTKITDKYKKIYSPRLSRGLITDGYYWKENVKNMNNNFFTLKNNTEEIIYNYEYEKINYSKGPILIDSQINIDVYSFDYTNLLNIFNIIDEETFNTTSNIIISITKYPEYGIITDLNKNPISSFNYLNISNVIYYNYDNSSILDTCDINIASGFYSASFTDIRINFNIINNIGVNISDENIFKIQTSNLITTISSENKENLYVKIISSNVIIENTNEYINLKDFKYFKLPTNYNNLSSLYIDFILLQSKNIINNNHIIDNLNSLYQTIRYNIKINNYDSTSIILEDYETLFNNQYLTYFINNDFFDNKTSTIKLLINPSVIFEDFDNNLFNFTLSFNNNNSRIYYLNITEKGFIYNNLINNFSNVLIYNKYNEIKLINTSEEFKININNINYLTVDNLNFNLINNFKIEYSLSSNIIKTLSDYNITNYTTSLYFKDLIFIIEDINIDKNINIGNTIEIEGLNNIGIGKNFNLIGNNNIVLGDTIGNNNIYESIIIGNSNFLNKNVKNVIALGNNNFKKENLRLNENSIYIGNDLFDTDKYDLNIGNTFLKEKESENIYLGSENISIHSNILNIKGELKTNILSLDNVNFISSCNVKSKITYYFPELPPTNNYLLSSSNNGELYWKNYETFQTDTIITSNILCLNSIIGDGFNIYNLNFKNKNTNELLEGTSNLYFTQQRATTNFNNNLNTKNTNNLLEGTSNLYYTEQRATNSFRNNFNVINTSFIPEGSNLYFKQERVAELLNVQLSLFNTNQLIEGTSNLYFTPQRVLTILNSNISLTFNTDIIREGTSNLYYTEQRTTTNFNNNLNTKNTNNLLEGTSNLYYTTQRSANDFDIRLSTKTTDNLQESLTRLYFTIPRFNTSFDDRLNTKTTDNLQESLTRLYLTDTRFSNYFINSLNNITLDNIKNGNNNKFINNNIYNGDLGIFGSLYSCNLILSDATLNTIKTNYVNDFILLFYSKNTNDISEGTSNLYYTEERTTTNFNNNLNTKNTNNIIEGTSNLYFTEQRTTANFNNNLNTKNTNNIIEGTSNLYYTEQRTTANFNSNIINITLDNIKNGTSNIFITNNIYSNDLIINGTLTASNINFGSSLTNIINNNLLFLNTDRVLQGTSNLYYTSGRFINDFSSRNTNNLLEGTSNLYYTSGRFINDFSLRNTNNLLEGTSNLYYTIDRDNLNFDIRLSTKTTDNLLEGRNNLYFTQQRTTANFNSNIINITLDTVKNGTSNIFITNNDYSNNLRILGNLTTSNINVFANVNIQGILFSSNIILNGVSINSLINNTIRNTDQVLEGTSNFYFTQQRATANFNNNIINITLDTVKNGTSNTFITNNDYSNNLRIFGNLTTSNINTDILFSSNIILNGVSINSLINNTIRNTDQVLEGTSNFYFTQQRTTANFNNNMINTTLDRIKNGTSNTFITNNNYNADLFVNGNFNSPYINTNYLNAVDIYINNVQISSFINNTIRNTDFLQEGTSNFYFTQQRATTNFNNNIINITLDTIKNGTSNTFITNNDYSNNLRILGNLNTSNINTNNIILNGIQISSFINNTIRNTDFLQEGTSNFYFTQQRATTNFNSNIINITLDTINNGNSNTFITNNDYSNNLRILGNLITSNIFVNNLNIIDYISNVYESCNYIKLDGGLNIYHKYNPLLPLELERWYNVDEYLTNIKLENSNFYYRKNVIDSSNIIFSNLIFNTSNNLQNYTTTAQFNNIYARLGFANTFTQNNIFNANVGIGTNNPLTNLHVRGKMFLNNTLFSTPGIGTTGGNGDRLILWEGNSTARPFSLGINSSELWLSIPGGTINNYVNGISILRIISTGISLSGSILQNTNDNTYLSVDFNDSRLGLVKQLGVLPRISSSFNNQIVFSTFPNNNIASFTSTSISSVWATLNQTGLSIGSNNPSEMIHIQKLNNDNYIKVDAGLTNNRFGGIIFSENGGYKGHSIRYDSRLSNLEFCSTYSRTSNNSNIIIQYDTGNIGIGTIRPNYKVDISSDSLNASNIFENNISLSTKYGLWNSNYSQFLVNQINIISGGGVNIINNSNIYDNKIIFNNEVYLKKFMFQSQFPNKKFFKFTLTNTNFINLNGINYYKYDINLNLYTSIMYIGNANDIKMRKFCLNTFLSSGYIQTPSKITTNEYDITMTLPLVNGSGENRTGLNIFSFSRPYENFYLNIIQPNNHFIISSDDFNCLTYMSTDFNIEIICFVKDYCN